VVLVCQGEQIPAHKLILGARSPVFHAMLNTDMIESKKGEVKIEDADTDVLKAMIRYMYTVNVDVSFTKFKELIVLADKYQVLELVNFCGNKLVESLSKENVLELGQLAERHNADKLLNKCIKYVLKNLPNSLNKDWKNHMKESPSGQIYCVPRPNKSNFLKTYHG